jgi:hypothetical protein
LIDEQGGVNGTGWLSGATVNVYGGFTTPAFSFPYLTCGVRPKAGTTATIVAATEDNSLRAITSFAVAQTPTLDVASPQQLSPLLLGATSISVVGSDWAPGATVSLVAAHLDMMAEADGNQRQTATPLPGAQTVHTTADARRRDGERPHSVRPGARHGRQLERDRDLRQLWNAAHHARP